MDILIYLCLKFHDTLHSFLYLKIFDGIIYPNIKIMPKHIIWNVYSRGRNIEIFKLSYVLLRATKILRLATRIILVVYVV